MVAREQNWEREERERKSRWQLKTNDALGCKWNLENDMWKQIDKWMQYFVCPASAPRGTIQKPWIWFSDLCNTLTNICEIITLSETVFFTWINRVECYFFLHRISVHKSVMLMLKRATSQCWLLSFSWKRYDFHSSSHNASSYVRFSYICFRINVLYWKCCTSMRRISEKKNSWKQTGRRVLFIIHAKQIKRV